VNNPASETRPRVGLFVTCLVDLFRPSVGFAAVKLLEDAGCDVHVPGMQTCCGQPAFNSGDNADAAELARRTIALFEGFDYVVVPSGSCGGMIKEHYAELLADDAQWAPRARHLAARCHELVSFLHDIRGVTRLDARYDGTITYHDSCSGLRELSVKKQPRLLLQSVDGLSLTEMNENEVCCGFGGTFAVKYGEISDSIVTKKAENIEAAEPDMLLAGDLGCLMNMAGKLSRMGSTIEVRHVAEVLAGMTDLPPIGAPSGQEKAR
jgi:L-lactate dehydrogenase complex protein LldE